MSTRIYRREESPTQTRADASDQVRSGEIWGRPHRLNGVFPQVKAYVGALSPGTRGIEFTTPIAPEWGSSSLFEHRWYHPQTPGVLLRYKAGVDYAAIPADVTNHQP